MTALKSTIPLDLNHGYFDSVEIGILSIAFEKAWAFVEFDAMLGQVELPKRQSELARCLMRQLKLGETNPTSLANTAIRMLRRASCALIGPPIATQPHGYATLPIRKISNAAA
jgi:hypothetical protein